MIRLDEPSWQVRGGIGLGLAGLVAALFLLSLSWGVVEISLSEMGGILMKQWGVEISQEVDPLQEVVFFHLRLPRVLGGLLIGGGLAVVGAAIQGLFRNPLAEPSLIGVSAGAAMGAMVGLFLAQVGGAGREILAPLGAFGGGLIATWMVYGWAQNRGKTCVTTLLLAGVALNALGGAVVGLFLFGAEDHHLRDMTFWLLGSLGEVSWQGVGVLAFFLVGGMGWLWGKTQPLNALLLGEAEAGHLGYDLESLKVGVIAVTALVVGISVSLAGMIGFVGLVVPHWVRLLFGPDHRFLLPISFLLGGGLLMGADLFCRSIGPAELPLGVVTALIGAPFFLWLMRKVRVSFSG